MKELLSYKRGIQAHFEQEAPFLRSSFNIIPGSKHKRQYVINYKLTNNVIIFICDNFCQNYWPM